MKVNGAQTRQRQDPSRDDGEVGNTEQVIEWPAIHRSENFVLAGDTTDLLFLGPFLDHIVSGYDGLYLVLVAQENLRAGDQKSSLP